MQRTLLTGMLTMVMAHAATARGAEHVVAPDGSPAGSGSVDSPWDLGTALGQPPSVQPGDTIVLRGGTYAGSFVSQLAGTEQAPITVRSQTGEWARIDLPALPPEGDGLTLAGQWTIYRDFEILVSDPTTPRDSTSVAVSGTSLLLANLVIHDGGNNMFHGTGSEIYGSILYNNGTDGAFLAHHLYAQNDDPARPSHITDCLIFNGFAFGIHAYATNGWVSGMHMVGNVWFNNGVAQTVGDRKDNCLVGSISNPPENVVLEQNLGWAASPSDRSVALGRYNSTNIDLALTDNYLVGATDFTNPWQSLTMTGNTFIGPVTGAVQPTSYPDNTYLAEAPGGTRVFVRPNREQPGRAHVVVYNWDGADSVEVDLSTVLSPGDGYEIRSGQNFFAPAVVAGTFDGTLVSLPMTAGDDPALPMGPGLIEAAERTGKAFNVFVVLSQGSVPPPPPDGGLGGSAGAGGAAGNGGSPGTGGTAGSTGAGATGAAAEEGSGCGCRTPGSTSPIGKDGALGAAGLGWLLGRRKRVGAWARAARPRRLAELAVVAEADPNPNVAASARQQALRQYQELCSSYPSYAKRDEALFDLGSELILAKDLVPARQAMLELIERHNSCKRWCRVAATPRRDGHAGLRQYAVRTQS